MLTLRHVEFLLLALHRMPCSGDEVVLNVECRRVLSALHRQHAPTKPAKPEAEPEALPEAPPRDAVSEALAELEKSEPPTNRAARRRRDRERAAQARPRAQELEENSP